MEDYDFSFQKSIDRSVVEDLMTLRFVHNMENVLFLGTPGVGKTHLSVAMGMGHCSQTFQRVTSLLPSWYSLSGRNT